MVGALVFGLAGESTTFLCLESSRSNLNQDFGDGTIAFG